MIHQREFYFISELIFVLNRHKDTSFSTIEFTGSSLDTMSNGQSILTFVNGSISELFLKKNKCPLAKVIGFKPHL